MAGVLISLNDHHLMGKRTNLVKFLVSDQDPEIFVVDGAHVLQNVHHHLEQESLQKKKKYRHCFDSISLNVQT